MKNLQEQLTWKEILRYSVLYPALLIGVCMLAEIINHC